jgi:hypothetical protein
MTNTSSSCTREGSETSRKAQAMLFDEDPLPDCLMSWDYSRDEYIVNDRMWRVYWPDFF